MLKTSNSRWGGVLEAKQLGSEAAGEMAAGKRGGLAAKSLAFTLAEVLITLAIIGVVAALTIPTVVAKYQKHQYYTQFMKVYSTLSEALSMAQNEYGDYDTWSGGASPVVYQNYINSNLIPFLKVAKKCSSANDCGVSSDAKVKPLNSSDSDETSYSSFFFNCGSDDAATDVYLLSDGALITFCNADLTFASLNIDTNGVKGPNVLGRDIFTDVKIYNQGRGYVITADTLDPEMSFESQMESFKGDDTEYNCTMEYESYGDWCAARLILEGKMDY